MLTDRQKQEQETWNQRASICCHDFPWLLKDLMGEYKKIITHTENTIDYTACKRILDVGCGRGLSTIAWAQLFPRTTVIGVDISQEMIRVAQENAKTPGLEDRCIFHVLNMQNSDLGCLGNEPFDIIFGRMVLHHFDLDELSMLAESLEKISHGKTAMIFVENSSRNPMLMWFRDHISGGFFMPKASIDTEYPLDQKRIVQLSDQLGLTAETFYHDMVMFKLLNRVPAIRRLFRTSLKTLDSLLFQIPFFRKWSYHQTIIFRNPV